MPDYVKISLGNICLTVSIKAAKVMQSDIFHKKKSNIDKISLHVMLFLFYLRKINEKIDR